MTQELFIAVIFLVYGLIATIRPNLIARFQKWSNKKILGAKFEAGSRTLKFYRLMGIVFLCLALLLSLGVIE